MDKNDIELIKNLYDISYKVKKIYEKLAKTEDSFGKNSKKYTKCMELLKMVLFFENKLYEQFNNDIDKISDIILYIASNSKNDLENQIYVLADNFESAFIEKRILEKMYLIAYKNNNFYKGFIDPEISIFKKCSDEVINYLREYKDLIDKEEIRRTIYYLSQIDYKDFNLNINMKDSALSKYKNEFINPVYLYVYLNPVIEDEIIKNNFNNPKNTFDNNILYKSKYEEFNEPIKSTLAYIKCADLLDELMTYNGCDGTIKGPDDIQFEELFSSFKANLLFLDDDALHYLLATVNEEYDRIEEDDDIQNIEDLVEYSDEDAEKEFWDVVSNFDLDDTIEIDKSDIICLDRIFRAIMDVSKEKENANKDNNCKKKTL